MIGLAEVCVDRTKRGSGLARVLLDGCMAHLESHAENAGRPLLSILHAADGVDKLYAKYGYQSLHEPHSWFTLDPPSLLPLSLALRNDSTSVLPVGTGRSMLMRRAVLSSDQATLAGSDVARLSQLHESTMRRIRAVGWVQRTPEYWRRWVARASGGNCFVCFRAPGHRGAPASVIGASAAAGGGGGTGVTGSGSRRSSAASLASDDAGPQQQQLIAYACVKWSNKDKAYLLIDFGCIGSDADDDGLAGSDTGVGGGTGTGAPLMSHTDIRSFLSSVTATVAAAEERPIFELASPTRKAAMALALAQQQLQQVQLNGGSSSGPGPGGAVVPPPSSTAIPLSTTTTTATAAHAQMHGHLSIDDLQGPQVVVPLALARYINSDDDRRHAAVDEPALLSKSWMVKVVMPPTQPSQGPNSSGSGTATNDESVSSLSAVDAAQRLQAAVHDGSFVMLGVDAF